MTGHAAVRPSASHLIARVSAVVFASLFVISLVTLFPLRSDAAPLAAGAAAAGDYTFTPTSGDSATTVRTALGGADTTCPGDAEAGYSWSTFLVPAGIDVATLSWGTGSAPAGFPDVPGWTGDYPPALAEPSGTFIVGRAPGLDDGFVSPPAEVSFAAGAYATLPAGDYQIGIACLAEDAGVLKTEKYWAGSITFSAQDGAGPNGFAFTSAEPAPTTTTTTTEPPPPADPRVGSQGTDTALPMTDSAVTVRGRGQYADLEITVNQTENLTRQAVSVTWTGGTPTGMLSGEFREHFLQVFQCWGDDDGTVADNPGPPPEQCVQGATRARAQRPDVGVSGYASSRVLSMSEFENFDPDAGFHETTLGEVWMPFRAVDGTVVDFMINPTFRGTGVYWRNQFFNIFTTNEIVAGRTYPDGTGEELLDVLTGVESTGLGCGQRVQPVAGGGVKEPQCWIVVVPRGGSAEENADTLPTWYNQPQFHGVSTSPLTERAWANRIAIPIEFEPVDTSCSIATVERRLAGTELLVPAMSSWQPILCTQGDLPPYSYAPVADPTARTQIANPTAGSAGLAVINRPLDDTLTSDDNPVVYVPLTASAVGIGFNIERPTFGAGAELAEYNAIQGRRIADMQLTPRLVAKLLTQSYQFALRFGGSVPDEYEWIVPNPPDLRSDPDFLQFNPEFQLMGAPNQRTTSGMLLPQVNSDYAHLVWEWILADPEAKAWLDGEPDEWGMQVNPVYSTDADLNPSGFAFGDPAPTSFPKSDPFCYQAPDQFFGAPPLLCSTQWQPYTRSLIEAARLARSGSDSAKISVNPFANTALEYWRRANPQRIGTRSMLALTDTPSAALTGVQLASLSRAGDNRGPGERVFIAATDESIAAAVDEMEPRDEPTVLQPVFDLPEDAYPLSLLTYGAIAPLNLDADAREEYAAFIEYAVGAGQVAGFEQGQLPPGYAPLSSDLKAAGEAGADLVTSLSPPPTTTTTTTTTVAPTTTRAPLTTTARTTATVASRPSNNSPATTSPPTTAVAAEVTTTTPSATTTTEPSDTTSTTIAVPPLEQAQAGPPQGDMFDTEAAPLGISRFAVPGLFALMTIGSIVALQITRQRRLGAEAATAV